MYQVTPAHDTYTQTDYMNDEWCIISICTCITSRCVIHILLRIYACRMQNACTVQECLSVLITLEMWYSYPHCIM